MIREAKKRSKVRFSNLVSTAVVAGLGYAAWQSGLVETAWGHLAGGHSRNEAEKVAEMISNSPECAPYRAAILNYSGKPDTDEVAARITYLYHKGVEAGCKRLDVE
ncbi:MAG TPA: hypothetical protein VFB36_15460 [Nevskiaceae bacterium]|nr:hypothetical protein [Nevskiaceae bacterium]